MNMILICANFQKLHLVSFLNVQTDFTQHFINLIIKYYSSILGWENQVIDQYRYIMTLMNEFAHKPILRRKRRGIQP